VLAFLKSGNLQVKKWREHIVDEYDFAVTAPISEITFSARGKPDVRCPQFPGGCVI
jgi:hypothetical protein